MQKPRKARCKTRCRFYGFCKREQACFGTEWGNPFFDPFRIIGALIVAIGFVLFAIIVFATREAAARS